MKNVNYFIGSIFVIIAINGMEKSPNNLKNFKDRSEKIFNKLENKKAPETKNLTELYLEAKLKHSSQFTKNIENLDDLKEKSKELDLFAKEFEKKPQYSNTQDNSSNWLASLYYWWHGSNKE